jgi:hypothetical protein
MKTTTDSKGDVPLNSLHEKHSPHNKQGVLEFFFLSKKRLGKKLRYGVNPFYRFRHTFDDS